MLEDRNGGSERGRDENEEKEKVEGKKNGGEEKKKEGGRHGELLFVGYLGRRRLGFVFRASVIDVMAHIQNALDG